MKLLPNLLEEASGGAAARELELRDKHARLHEWLDREKYEGVLLRRHENLAWISAGQVEARVAIPSETACGGSADTSRRQAVWNLCK